MDNIPVVDLFAGPGGLGEGFSSVRTSRNRRAFRLALSIEKEPTAHRTLTLRSMFRSLSEAGSLDLYYDYVRGRIQFKDLLKNDLAQAAYLGAQKEAQCAELGRASQQDVDRRISESLGDSPRWVLIGGPPCQAYSLAGRSRRTNDETFAADERHVLYREYLRIISRHHPDVFVMENVKGILSSQHEGKSIFTRILDDLARPSPGVEYEIRSFVYHDLGLGVSPRDYLIESENYGIPQRRHRVILLGVRKCSGLGKHELLKLQTKTSVSQVIRDLPKLRSRLSSNDAADDWLSVLSGTVTTLRGWRHPAKDAIAARMELITSAPRSSGGPYISRATRTPKSDPLSIWIQDERVGGIIQHEARSHMAADLHRYLFAACYAEVTGRGPRLRDFPARLLPRHRNATAEDVPFEDRFRVQLYGEPATTVVSHIAKDGHYYIHPDPKQCRSLTVREAARLQTFPDNYFFEGNRTQQYVQVGNAVPPYLAKQLGQIVADLILT